MPEITFNESVYKFVEPIRYFKANDPYYFEVDNIPLKQLQENVLWLKDQMAGDREIKFAKVKREDFDELRPYVSDPPDEIRVRPGRFTARINDAYKLVGGDRGSEGSGGEGFCQIWDSHNFEYPLEPGLPRLGDKGMDVNFLQTRWNVKISDESVRNMLAKFKTKTLNNATGQTGLQERVFTYPVIHAYKSARDRLNSGEHPVIKGMLPNPDGWMPMQAPFPLTEILMWALGDSTTKGKEGTHPIKGFDYSTIANGFMHLPVAENYLTKKWKGIFRTSIVDVPEELSIKIPEFAEQDFHYFIGTPDPRKGPNFEKITIDGPSLRIDLLFIYSKPVDTSSVSVMDAAALKQGAGAPNKHQQAFLGIVKGAGLGLNFVEPPSKSTPHGTWSPQASHWGDGHPVILANASDEDDPNMGFKELNIRGSFPSPDDLMNITPQLMDDVENYEYDDLELVGQSVLPVAYIVVRQGASKKKGKPVIAEADVIDIRPFFRTTELSYNERAGVANATPSLSLANPAVGKAQMYHELSRVNDEINNLEKGETQQFPRTIATGYIFGGRQYGTDGCLMGEMNNRTYGNPDQDGPNGPKEKASMRKVNDEYGLPQFIPGTTEQFYLPFWPDWDQPRWRTSIAGGSWQPNDWIDFIAVEDYSWQKPNFSSYRWVYNDSRYAARTGYFSMPGFGTEPMSSGGQSGGQLTTHFVSKRIYFDLPEDYQDYRVNVNYWNCVPITNRSYSVHSTESRAGHSGIWVEKHGKASRGGPGFSINVAFLGQDHSKQPGQANRENRLGEPVMRPHYVPAFNRRDAHYFAAFASLAYEIHHNHMPLRGKPIKSSQWIAGEGGWGVGTYPSVEFEVVGIPKAYASHHMNLGDNAKLTVF